MKTLRELYQDVFDVSKPCPRCWVWLVVFIGILIGWLWLVSQTLPDASSVRPAPPNSGRNRQGAVPRRPAVSRSELPSRSGEKPEPRKEPTAVASRELITLGDEGWVTVRGSSFGGPGDYQPTAYSLDTKQLIDLGIYFVALRHPEWANRAVMIRYKGQLQTALILDYGPAEWTRRDIDLGQNLADVLHYNTDDLLEYKLLEVKE